MKESKTEIKKIVLQLGEKEVSLTVDEAKKLKEILSEMFGKEIIRETVHQHHYKYDWYYSKPYYTQPFYCGSGGNAQGGLLAGGIQTAEQSMMTFKNNAVYCAIS